MDVVNDIIAWKRDGHELDDERMSAFVNGVVDGSLASYQARMLAFSFLLGFVVKAVVSHLGGASLHERVKPVMIGLIAGDLLGAILPNLIGAAYYFITGLLPRSFSVIS